MTLEAPAPRAPLWAQVQEDDEQALALWKAVLIALALELLVPFLVLGVDWSFLPSWSEPPPIPVMTAQLREPPPPPPEDKPKPKPKRPEALKQIAVELPPPLPADAKPKIELAKQEEKKKPDPQREEEPPPQPEPQAEPEPETPPLPSVFQDVKPVRKARIKYPPEAEAQHIQGRVKVRLSVDLEGNVTNVEVLLAEPAGVFEEAVLEGVRQYKFKKDGSSYRADQEIIFKIDD